jgi:potassium-transporting ATPase KdpC subunit
MRAQLKPALLMYLWLTVLTGIVYPLAVTIIGQIAFPAQANGSLLGTDGKYLRAGEQASGSLLIGQPFTSAGYFWSRPSATTPYPYNGAASCGSNLGPVNPLLNEVVRQCVTALEAASQVADAPIPVDLVTASGSGLDPHISPAAALYQAPRVAEMRGLDSAQVEQLVREHVEGRTLGLLGEPRVNVLQLNLELDRLVSKRNNGQ